ncbi:MAG: ABC-type transport auxiliary lipoprotein family protein [Pseudomonadota bacterium]
MTILRACATSSRWLTATALLALGACGPLVQIGGNAKPADSLLTLTSSVETPTTLDGGPVLIVLPSVPGALRTTRIPVIVEDNELQYLVAASWIEQPNFLFHRVLADTVEARTGRPALDEGNVDVLPALRLSGKLMNFGLDARAAPQVIVRYDAVLTSIETGLVGTRRFEATEPVSAETGPVVAQALGVATNRITADIADWIGTTPPTVMAEDPAAPAG